MGEARAGRGRSVTKDALFISVYQTVEKASQSLLR